jgi:cytoskeletal protein CcmA (bactofilin family)
MLFGRRSDRTTRTPEPAPERTPRRTPATATESGTAGGAPVQSFIDASLTIVGDLHSAGDVRIDGRICGNVRCAQLILGRDAAVTGTVVAAQAIVRGKIVGTIRAPVVIIQATAHVESEITYSLLTVDDGAFFEGSVHRSNDPLLAEERPAAAPPLPNASSSAAEGPGAAASAGDAAKRNDAEGAAAEPVAQPAEPPPASKGKAAKPSRHAPLANGHSQAG